MDKFARVMSMEGVRPLDQLKRRSAPAGDHRHSTDEKSPESTQSTPAAEHAWVSGPGARTVLDTALGRLATEGRNGGRGWAVGVRQDGTPVTLQASSGSASLLATADRQSLRLIIVGGDGWTFVMHPLMGAATLDQDPFDRAYSSPELGGLLKRP